MLDRRQLKPQFIFLVVKILTHFFPYVKYLICILTYEKTYINILKKYVTQGNVFVQMQ